MGGLVTQPVQLITTLAALLTLENSDYTGSARLARAPISVIRVRVAGVTGPNPASLNRIKTIAEQIELRTHLTVDIVAGSSPVPTTVAVPPHRTRGADLPGLDPAPGVRHRAWRGDADRLTAGIFGALLSPPLAAALGLHASLARGPGHPGRDGAALATYRRTVGFVFQRYNLLPALTALDNVIAPVLPYRTGSDKPGRGRQLLEEVGLGGREQSLPLADGHHRHP